MVDYKKYIWAVLVFGLVAVLWAQIFYKSSPVFETVLLNNRPYKLEVTQTAAAKENGLSGRHGLAENKGMIFKYDSENLPCFWMKDMSFNIDILWFDRHNSLVYVVNDASPSSYPSVFCPTAPAQTVIELPAGTAKTLGLKVGDEYTESL